MVMSQDDNNSTGIFDLDDGRYLVAVPRNQSKEDLLQFVMENCKSCASQHPSVYIVGSRMIVWPFDFNDATLVFLTFAD